MVLTSNLRVNGDRLWDSLMDMAQIGLVCAVAITAKP